jgi:HAD superfamily hydrolase (TIGR01509 family)
MSFKAVIFDMDGVLIDARDWHYEALNSALRAFGMEISYEEHLERFNGLSTRQKLKYLTDNQNLPTELHRTISDTKQNRTLRIAAQKCYPNTQHLILLDRLRNKEVLIGVYTNSIRETAEAMLKYAGLLSKIDVLITNQDVINPKPDPEGYLLVCKKLCIRPEDALVVEDGEYGIQSATSAGCCVVRVESPSDVSIQLISKYVPELLN